MLLAELRMRGTRFIWKPQPPAGYWHQFCFASARGAMSYYIDIEEIAYKVLSSTLSSTATQISAAFSTPSFCSDSHCIAGHYAIPNRTKGSELVTWTSRAAVKASSDVLRTNKLAIINFLRYRQVYSVEQGFTERIYGVHYSYCSRNNAGVFRTGTLSEDPSISSRALLVAIEPMTSRRWPLHLLIDA